MMQTDTLALRDIHQPPAPPGWPPAPGWWVVAGCVVLILAIAGVLAWRRHARCRALARVFDAAIAAAATPSEKVAAMSQLLRRAARRIDPEADKLLGDDWLRFLDRGLRVPVFAGGAGAPLRDAAFRRDVPAAQVDALRPLARARFLEWMGPK
jgi:hypothetical protein